MNSIENVMNYALGLELDSAYDVTPLKKAIKTQSSETIFSLVKELQKKIKKISLFQKRQEQLTALGVAILKALPDIEKSSNAKGLGLGLIFGATGNKKLLESKDEKCDSKYPKCVKRALKQIDSCLLQLKNNDKETNTKK